MKWIVLPLAALAVTVSPAAHGTDTACPATLASSLQTGPATQLVTVIAHSRASTQGTLRLWRKRARCWRAAKGPWTAWLGQRGSSPAKREGDRRTPSGIFGFGRVMYGLARNPGVRFRYRQLVCGDWWVEDPASPYYNQFRHVRCGSKPPFRVKSEDMSRSPTAYRHLAVVAYNTSPVVPGRGSGIFLHASTGRATLGCVSLPLPQLLTTLRSLRPGAARIAIGTAADLRALSSR